MKLPGPKAAWFCVLLLLAILSLYVIERLYVTPEEAVNQTVSRSIEAVSNEQFDKLDRQLHDRFFSSDPPSFLRSLLRRQGGNSNEFTRQRFRDGLRRFFERISYHRHVVTSQEVDVSGKGAVVELSLLSFYSEDENGSKSDLRKSFTSWTIRLKLDGGHWLITELYYGG